jgi:hypothetical protein
MRAAFEEPPIPPIQTNEAGTHQFPARFTPRRPSRSKHLRTVQHTLAGHPCLCKERDPSPRLVPTVHIRFGPQQFSGPEPNAIGFYFYAPL